LPEAVGQEIVADRSMYGSTEPRSPSTVRVEYKVVKGDTLSHIAESIGLTWQELWAMNPQIKDPNLIYEGQIICIRGTPKPKPVLTREQKIEKLALFMFKKSGIPSVCRENTSLALVHCRNWFIGNENQYMYDIRQQANAYSSWTRVHEIWLLSEAIVDLCIDETEFTKIVGLAWQETHFVNQRGKHGERGFFQVLPSTIKSHYDLDDIGLVSALWNIENNPKIATSVAIDMLRDYKWNWKLWNHGLDYEYHLNNKIYGVKQEFKI